jgi:ribulose-bisphosphate carboxylase large chain
VDKTKWFTAQYAITAGNMAEAKERAFDICVEQTVEFPYDLIKKKSIKENIVGKISSLSEIKKGFYKAEILFPSAAAGNELTQLLNVLFGNISIKPGIRLERFNLTGAMSKTFSGPRFGVKGIKKITGNKKRPLVCSALKPMGTSVKELAELAYKFALGGIDIIKDDHGLADQKFSPFNERVKRCTEAVRKANKQTGYNTVYMPNVTGDGAETLKRAKFASKCGAGAVIISGALSGFASIFEVSKDTKVNVPVFFHPAFAGSFTSCQNSGISHYALYGQLTRLSGADAAIFPSYGGRFSFSKEECRSIVNGCTDKFGKAKSIMPAPGGGMTVERAAELKQFYGNDAVFLIGGGLFRHSDDITKSVRDFISCLI